MEHGLRQGGVVANAFGLIRLGATVLDWVADFGPNGGQQGAAAAVEQPDEQGPGLHVIDAIEDGQQAAAPLGELDDEAAAEVLPQVEQVEGGMLATGMELLGYLLELLRVLVLQAPVYVRLFVFVLGVSFGASLGAFVVSGTSEAMVAPLNTTAFSGNYAPYPHRELALRNDYGALFGPRWSKGSSGVGQVVVWVIISTGTEPSFPPPGVKMVEPHYNSGWLRRFSVSSGGATAGDQAAHNPKATDDNGNSTDPSRDAKANKLKDKLKARLGSWRSSMENARNRHGRDLSSGVSFLSGE